MLTETIAAISTPLGEGGISVIRVSGYDSLTLIEKIFKSKSLLTSVASHTIHYGHIINPQTGELIDEVLVSVMHAPRTFTMENTIEISCHGGILITSHVLDVILNLGIRLAEPGEFTKRAFLNGRIDLTKAEAVIDLIKSKSALASKNALKQIKGELSKQIEKIRFRLVTLMAHIEVNIDYPEHDIHDMTNNLIESTLIEILIEIESLIHYSNQGQLLREGIQTAIVGKPNVGKSSLLNRLTQQNKAIVTDIPGTTRDIIEQFVSINNIPLKLLDTAGIRDTSDTVEKLGVERSKLAMDEADLLLLVLSNNEILDKDDILLINSVQNRNAIVIINKIDLPRNVDLSLIRSKINENYIVEISLIENSGIDTLENLIKNMFYDGKLETEDMTYVSNIRHVQLLKKARKCIKDAMEANQQLIPIDIIQLDLKESWENLGEIIGDTVSETLIDQIFSQFCLGK